MGLKRSRFAISLSLKCQRLMVMCVMYYILDHWLFWTKLCRKACIYTVSLDHWYHGITIEVSRSCYDVTIRSFVLILYDGIWKHIPRSTERRPKAKHNNRMHVCGGMLGYWWTGELRAFTLLLGGVSVRWYRRALKTNTRMSPRVATHITQFSCLKVSEKHTSI